MLTYADVWWQRVAPAAARQAEADYAASLNEYDKVYRALKEP